jgi:hypothetical protein
MVIEYLSSTDVQLSTLPTLHHPDTEPSVRASRVEPAARIEPICECSWCETGLSGSCIGPLAK